VSNAIPTSAGGAVDNCARFSNSSSPEWAPEEHCPPSLFDNSTTEACQSYVYQRTDSVVYDVSTYVLVPKIRFVHLL
jgi:hypothetical protein